MRYTIETAPKNGNIVVLEDDTSGFLEVAHWSPEAGEWIRESGEPIEIKPSHWHACYSFAPFSSSDAPQPLTITEATSPARRGFAIPWSAAKVIAAVLIGIYLLQAVLHTHALNEERARSSALERELVMARRETVTTSVAPSGDTKGDNVSPLKTADSPTAEIRQPLRQEHHGELTSVEEIPTAAKQPEGGLPENSKAEIKPNEIVPPNRRAMSLNVGCQRYRTYDPASATYKGYDGQRDSCP